MTKYVSINPAAYKKGDETRGEFAALVVVKTSRYTTIPYPDDFGGPKIGIEWTLGTVNNKEFKQSYSTGLKPGELADISPDGKRLIRTSSDFNGIKEKSDAMYFLRKVGSSNFPMDLLTDDVSVFDNHVFYIATDVNPNSTGSSKKPYPKEYHPEGWEAASTAVLAKRATRAAEKAANEAQAAPVSSYTPPAVVVQPNILEAAGGALVAILGKSGGKVNRGQLLTALNEYDPVKKWEPSFRQQVTLALWEIPQLTQIVSSKGFKIDGETVSA